MANAGRHSAFEFLGLLCTSKRNHEKKKLYQKIRGLHRDHKHQPDLCFMPFQMKAKAKGLVSF
jgi:hypothetical protein